MPEVAIFNREQEVDFTLSEIPQTSGGRRFEIVNPEKGLSAEAMDIIRRHRIHYIYLLDPKQDVGIRAECKARPDGWIRVHQANLVRPYFFDSETGAHIE
jgi:hypothetical protein